MPAKKKFLKVKRSKGPKVRDAKGVQESFDYVLKMVEDGWTISEACELSNIDRGAFYKFITEEQKNLLMSVKFTHSKVGCMIKMSLKKKEEPEIPKELKEDAEFKELIEKSQDIDWNWQD